jgi:hypothetical protein
MKYFRSIGLMALTLIQVSTSIAETPRSLKADCFEQIMSTNSRSLDEAQAEKLVHPEISFYNSRRLLRMNQILTQAEAAIRKTVPDSQVLDGIKSIQKKLHYPQVKAWDDPTLISMVIGEAYTEVENLLSEQTELSEISQTAKTKIISILETMNNPLSWVPEYCSIK